MILLWLILWFWYGWFFVLWLCHRNLMFSATPTTTIPKAHLRSRVALWFFFLALRFCVCGPPAPTRATQHRKPTTANKHGTWLPPQQSHSQSWNMDGSDLKSQAQKNQIVYLCICHSRLTRIIPVRPCRLFLGSLGTSLWEALSGKSWHIALRSLRGGKSCGAVDSDVFHFNIGPKLPFFRAERGKVVLKSD